MGEDQIAKTDELMAAVARLIAGDSAMTQDTPAATGRERHDHDRDRHGEQSLNRLSVSATVHCMTGCVLGEVAGLVIATVLGWSNLATIALAVSLAFLFGYALTSLPLIRAGLSLRTIVPIALATDTVSITIMELIENVTMLVFRGAMDAYIDA